LPPGKLAQVLRQTVVVDDERLLVGPESFDDAGVVRLGQTEGLPDARVALVQTVDFFPPVVDDPALYGEIAAANSLSDVYAMGGRPFSALAIAGFPKDFSEEWRVEIMRAGAAKVREAGAVLAGGHTVESDVQFGYSVTGLIDPGRVRANAGARTGDVAYLTKSLGMGCMTTAAKLRKISWEEVEPAARQMAVLNDRAAEAMDLSDAHACTDITGFGLVGHAMNIARSSEVTFTVEVDSVPLFPGALELAKRGLFSGAMKRGRETFGGEVSIGKGLVEAHVGLFFDAETSGGLLIVVPEERAVLLEAALTERDLPVHRIGVFTEPESVGIVLR
jgi:selenide,water dikinase